MEIGEAIPDREQLFDRLSFTEALPEVSQVLLMQTLSEIWNVSEARAQEIALRLVSVGFFGGIESAISPQYWVLF